MTVPASRSPSGILAPNNQREYQATRVAYGGEVLNGPYYLQLGIL